MDWLATLLLFAAVGLSTSNRRKVRQTGFYLGAGSNLLWLWWGLGMGLGAIVAVNLVVLVLNGLGAWRQRGGAESCAAAIRTEGSAT